LHTYCWRYRF